jgi:hypothetical protein
MDKTTLEQVREYIRHASANDIKQVYDICSSRMKHIQAELSMDFSRGDRVYFIKGKRSPMRIVGTVVAADGKWVYLNVDGRMTNHAGWNWKVAPSLLKRG